MPLMPFMPTCLPRVGHSLQHHHHGHACTLNLDLKVVPHLFSKIRWGHGKNAMQEIRISHRCSFPHPHAHAHPSQPHSPYSHHSHHADHRCDVYAGRPGLVLPPVWAIPAWHSTLKAAHHHTFATRRGDLEQPMCTLPFCHRVTRKSHGDCDRGSGLRAWKIPDNWITLASPGHGQTDPPAIAGSA